MPILKSEIRNKFTTIPNSVIRDKDLSDGDYRLLIYLYSLPDSWRINQTYLGKELGCARENINRKIKRIKDVGYLEIIKSNKENETDYIYVLKEKDMCQKTSQGVCQEISHVIPSDVIVSDTYINTNIINTDNKVINNTITNTESSCSSLINFIEEQFQRPIIPSELEIIQTWEDTELLRYAIKQATLNRVCKIKYIQGILNNFKDNNITTVEEALEQEEKFKKQKDNKKGFEDRLEKLKRIREDFLKND